MKPIFPFDTFYKIIAEDYDKDSSDLEICNLYKDAYISGGCKITCDSVLVTFCESNFWVNYLRLKGQNEEPQYNSRGEIDQSTDKGKECTEVYS